MADGTHLPRFLTKPCRIEVGTMGIEASPSLSGVAHETIALRMTGHARFETHPRGGTVSQDEGPLRIVKARTEDRAGRDEPRRFVARLAEGAGIVAFGARRFPRIRRSGMAFEKSHRVISRILRGRRGAMTVEALAAVVTGGAGPRVGGCRRAVRHAKVRTMRGRLFARDLGTNPWARCDRRQRGSDARCPDMADLAARLRVAGSAVHTRVVEAMPMRR